MPTGPADLLPLPPGALGLYGGVLVAVVAAVQLALHRRLDLGPLTVASGCVVWQLAGPGVPLAIALSVAAPLAAAAWWRAALRGVGRPELTGLVLAVAVLGQTAGRLIPAVLPAVPSETVEAAGLGLVALAGLVSVLLAAERRGLKGQRTYVWGEVPVRSRRDAAPSETP